jgi:hypothetical protein
MKTPTSSESGYFYPRISVASLLCICAAWLAAISFAPSALAWNITYGGSPGYVTWGNAAVAPVIGMGFNSPGSADFTIPFYRRPTIGMSSAGTYWQRAAVTMYVYYYCAAGRWCEYSRDTKWTPWTHQGASATVDSPRVTPIPTTGTYLWTSIIQIVWYNYPSYQWVAWENFYPDRTGTAYFPYNSSEIWHGNADMAINVRAERERAGRPWGPLNGYNLNTPTGYIYVLQGLRNN